MDKTFIKIGFWEAIIIFLICIAPGLLFVGCATIRSWNDAQEQKSFNRGLKYRKDPGTGLCFAVLHDRGLAMVDKKYCERKPR